MSVNLVHRIALGLLAPVMACALTGCWSKEEMNDRTFVTSIMVDRTEDGMAELTLSFLLPNRLPSAQGAPPPKEKPYTAINRTGRNYAEAYQKIQRELSRRITWGSSRIIVVGDRSASSGLGPLLEFLLRIPGIRLSSKVFYFDGEAKQIASMKPIFERFPSEIIREYGHMKHVPEVSVKDLIYSSRNNLGDGFLPELRFEQKEMATQNGKISDWLGNAGAILLKDDKKQAYLSAEPSRGIQWLKEDILETIVTVPSPSDGRPISLLIHDGGRKISFASKGQQLNYAISLRCKGELVSSESDLDITEYASIETIEQAVSEQIRKEMKGAFQAAKKHKTDAFQWSEYVKWKRPELWRRWKEREPERFVRNAGLQISVDVKLKRLGSGRSVVRPPKTD